MIFELLFWFSALALIHSYIFFPVLLSYLSRNKKRNQIIFELKENLPRVSIIMAVHNEEDVITDKLKSIFFTHYPLNRFEVHIGSDNSTDSTNMTLRVFAANYNNLHFTEYKKRIGKPGIINQLVGQTNGEILIITDANIFLEETTIFEIVKHFRNPEIGLVDTRVYHRGKPGKGISVQEGAYMMREVSIKDNEGAIWGTMMGPFGGCFAVRKKLFMRVPHNFLVDDFYINMSVLTRGYKAINSPTAYVSEDLSVNLSEEFRRKIRIATGSFQNLSKFARVLWPPFTPLSFCFFSHKLLRWLGPFFILLALVSNIFLYQQDLYKYLLILQISIFIIPLADFILRKLNLEIIVLRFVTHFLSMNLALFFGFFRYVIGVKSNIWQPTRRNQSE